MNFTCPYCSRHTTITDPNRDDKFCRINIASKNLDYNEPIGLAYKAISCPNEECKKLTLSVQLTVAKDVYSTAIWKPDREIHSWGLLPDSHAKPQGDYIPPRLRQDYEEACRIKDLSPKASATLARRCLQGMIRDFHGIKKGTLAEEIQELQGRVLEIEWGAIDALRSVGNIGAHMEKDVNVIVDITPNEAQALIELIEYLFRQWYDRRHEDQRSLERVRAIKDAKSNVRKQSSDATKAAKGNID